MHRAGPTLLTYLVRSAMLPTAGLLTNRSTRDKRGNGLLKSRLLLIFRASSTYRGNHVNTRSVNVWAVFMVKLRTIASSSFNLCTKLLTKANIGSGMRAEGARFASRTLWLNDTVACFSFLRHAGGQGRQRFPNRLETPKQGLETS